MFKKIILVFLLFVLVSPALVLAEGNTDSNIPELNPLCWQKSKCEAARKDYFGIDDNKNSDSWCIQEYPCKGNVSGSDDYWCKCLPAGQVNTAIKIGGTSTFSNLGVYLITVYDYALKVAGIIAVLVIIVAGTQWLTSGGNGSIIESAKKRILGAFIGLFIAYGSFFILNTINPALVNFRLPQTWMLKPQELIPEFCSALSENTMFALAAKSDNQKNSVSGPMSGEKYQYSYKDAKAKSHLDWFECGKRFVSKDGGSATCFGDYCKPGNFCGDFGITSANKKYECKNGSLGGKINGMSGQISLMDQGDDLYLFAYCGNGAVKNISYIPSYSGYSQKGDPYYFASLSAGEIDNACSGEGDVIGFFIGIEVNDESGGLGNFVEGSPYSSTGNDDWFAVGQVAPGSHNCSVNLAKKFLKNQCGVGNVACGCSMATGNAQINMRLMSDLNNNLISKQELKAGYSCNINLTRTEFPAINSDHKSFTENLAFVLTGTVAGATVGSVAGGAGALPGALFGAGSTLIEIITDNLTDPTKCFFK